MRWVRWVFVLYLAAVLGLTLWPSLDQTSVPGWATSTVAALARIGIHTSVAALEALSNLVMFLPFGVLGVVLLAYARRAWSLGAVLGAVALAGFVFSGAIETTQLLIPGRVSTLQDVLLNGGGGLLGACVAAVLVARFARTGMRD
ncbi:VanZ family protein [Xylanimonas protaetiae]|uniref:VanZ family protein n=1 Tax=Xylanimonas protaetiae TaxID=2509457 RepID=A0A4V0YG13_9MICO|nr:VanZ family protein [Xylanimonas protaetiae]QAY69611.1 VanZ family protein [Xylanimonas protaetiae]